MPATIIRTALIAATLMLGGCRSSPETSAPDAGTLADAGSQSSVDAGMVALRDAGLASSPDAGLSDGGCGYEGRGTPVHVAQNIDVCLPPVVCDPETCPPQVADCVNGACVFHAGYEGVATLPEAWSTYYCDLSTGGCHGVTQNEFPEVTAQKIATARGLVLCDQAMDGGSAECVGIAAAPPMLVGNSEVAVDPVSKAPVTKWGLGMTEPSGLCYELTGPGGSVLVALTDRCGGYCRCNGSGFQECGPCVNAPDLEVQCPCVGTVPTLYSECCGDGCPTLNGSCDWCASNNHPHFDLDTGTFARLCGSSAAAGSCKLSSVRYVSCLPPESWPPGASTTDGGTSATGSCPADSFECSSSAAHQEQISGSNCCCDWNMCPDTNGCTMPPASCKAGSCACASGQPDTDHASVPSTGCCCLSGLTPQPDGTCQ